MILRRIAAVALLAVVSAAGPASARADLSPLDHSDPGVRAGTRVPHADGPLAGRVVVIDPGHQLGNHNFPEQINRPVPAGRFTKPCNTTGTATGGGDVRGRAGNSVGADLKLSIHADGSYAAGARGFPVIAPADRAPWTDDIFEPSSRLARDVRAGLVAQHLTAANYVAGGDGLDVRSDLGTLNLSDAPTVMAELGNMRSSAEARVMTTAAGPARYARGLVAGVRTFLR